MELPNGFGALAYGCGAHPHRTWTELRSSLVGPVAEVKARAAPDRTMAIGLRFSDETAEELAAPAARRELLKILADLRLQPITASAFAAERSDSAASAADWRSDVRIASVVSGAELIAALNGSGSFATLSISPGAFRTEDDADRAAVAENLLRAISHLVDLEAKTGRRVALAIEPEPSCFIETVAEAIDFFQSLLFSDAAAARLAALTGLTAMAAMQALPRHIGLCYDACHAAVVFEDAADGIARLRSAKIPIHKLQLSTAIASRDGAAARRAFANLGATGRRDQVAARCANGIRKFGSVSEALAGDGPKDGAEWRVRAHAPIAPAVPGDFETTRAFLSEIVALHRAAPLCEHLEIESFPIAAGGDDGSGASTEGDPALEMIWATKALS